MDSHPLIAQMENLEPRLLFTQSKVFVKTSPENRDGMPGFMSLIESVNSENILSWTPEASIPSLDEDSYVDISGQDDNEVTKFVAPPRSPNLNRHSFHPSDYEVSVPLQNIYSLIVYPPRLRDRQGSIIVNLVGGESLPAFYFHEDGLAKGKSTSGAPPTWGGQELLNRIEQLVDVVGSAIEPGVYLVNASQADKINHGAATPPHPLSPNTNNQTIEEVDHSGRLYPTLDDPLTSQEISALETAIPTSQTLGKTATTTATGPITVEGMRRRRSLSESSRDRSTRDEYSQFNSASRSPTAGSSRSRTPLPLENHIDPLLTTVKELRWNILERFSQVARFSRDAATTVLDHPLTKQILPPHVQQRIQESEAAKRIMEDYDSARVYLARWAATVAEQGDRERRENREMERLHPGQVNRNNLVNKDGRRISDQEDEEGPLGSFNVLDLEAKMNHTRTEPLSPMGWFAFFDDAGRLIVSEDEVREAVFRGGIDHDIRIEVWKYFLGVYPWNSTEAERVAIRAAKTEEYFALKREWFDDPAVQETEEFQEQKLRIEKDVHRTDRTISFFASETLPNPSGDFTGVGSNENLELLKDILLTYNVWSAKPVAAQSVNKKADTHVDDSAQSSSSPAEPNLLEGYVQGMSDLLAPVFAVMGDEVMGFWAFVGLMEKTKKNFYRDQVGMQSQLETLGKMIQVLDPKLYKHLEKCEALNLFFCFRWLLIWFKREFEWVDIMRLWEVLFSDHLSTQFQLFVAMSILDKHRDIMMDHLQGFDEILKYVNDLSMTIDLEETLQNAEIIYRRLEHLVEKIDNKRIEEGSPSTDSTTSSGEEILLSLRKVLKVRS